MSAQREKTVDLLQRLVRTPSINPWFGGDPEQLGEAAVQRVLSEEFEQLGAELDRWEPDSEALERYAGRPGHQPGRDFTDRPNLVARLQGRSPGRSLLIAGHADTVSVGEGWSVDPFAADREAGMIYGRGTADMKAGLAAAAGALEILRSLRLRPRGDVLIASVVDEEAGGMGTLALVDRGYRADAAVIPEPNNLHVAPLCRGILWGRLTVPGRSGHIEMPQPSWRDGGAVDAVEKGRLVMDAIDRLNRRWADEPQKNHPLLLLPCQVRIAQVSAGEHPTTYAQEMQLTVDVQYLPHERDSNRLGGHVRQEVEEFVREVAETDEWLREKGIGVEWLLDADCGEIPSDHALVRACQAAAASAGAEVAVQGMSSHTDMGLLIEAGVPTVTFGPGASDVAHQPDECVSEDDLMRMTAAMALLILDWCGFDEAGA